MARTKGSRKSIPLLPDDYVRPPMKGRKAWEAAREEKLIDDLTHNLEYLRILEDETHRKAIVYEKYDMRFFKDRRDLPIPAEKCQASPTDIAFREQFVKKFLEECPKRTEEEDLVFKIQNPIVRNPHKRRPYGKENRKEAERSMIKDFKRHVADDDLMKALSGQLETKYRKLLDLIVNPKNADVSLPVLCGRAGVAYIDLVQAVKELKLGESILRMLFHAPDAVEDTAKAAKSVPAPCQYCKGEGCKYCDSTGIRMIPGDDTSRKLLFEALGLTGQKGPAVAQQINIGVGESLEGTLKSVPNVFNIKKEEEEEKNGTN